MSCDPKSTSVYCFGASTIVASKRGGDTRGIILGGDKKKLAAVSVKYRFFAISGNASGVEYAQNHNACDFALATFRFTQAPDKSEGRVA